MEQRRQVGESAGRWSAFHGPPRGVAVWRKADGQRRLQLVLAALWLLDGVLQLQPMMFVSGSRGLSGMLAGTASRNPGWVAHSITWNAALVGQHAAVAGAVFASVQILIGLGIAWRPSTKVALASSVVWALGVWWFGEGLGGILRGAGTPLNGGPGAVLLYAVLALLLWPADRRRDTPFIAARTLGCATAQGIWVALWSVMALLAVAGGARSPQLPRHLIQGLVPGQPSWLAALDRAVASAVSHQGLVIAVVLAGVSLGVAAGVLLPAPGRQMALVFAALVSTVVWVLGENFGMVLAGGATDLNSGPLLLLLVATYWPLRRVTEDLHQPVTEALPVEAL